MCKVPLNPSSDPSKKPVYVRINQRQLSYPPSHPSHWPRCRNGQNSSGCKRVTGLKQPFTRSAGSGGFGANFPFYAFSGNQKNIQKQHIRPSPNNKTLILSGTANCVLYIGFLPMNINIKCAPSHLEHDMHTLQRSLEMFQIAPVGQRCGFGNTRSDTNTQSVNVGMPLDYR